MDFDDDWLEKLVRDTHREVDEARVARGLEPWLWHKTKRHVLGGPLADLIKLVDEKGREIMRDYSCRTKCGFVGHSPRDMHNHYQQYPNHKSASTGHAGLVNAVNTVKHVKDNRCRALCGFVGEGDVLLALRNHYLDHPEHKITAYEAKKLREGKTVNRRAVSGMSRPRVNGRPMTAFEQIHALRDAFVADMNKEHSEIKRLEGELVLHQANLQQLSSALSVLTVTLAAAEPKRVVPETEPADPADLSTAEIVGPSTIDDNTVTEYV